MEVLKSLPDEEKSKMDEQTLADFSSAHRRSEAKCQLVQASYIKRINFFLFVITTSVKILPYRPPARLIRAKYLTAIQ